MHACEAVTAHFIYGSQICGVEATKTVPGEFEAEKHFVCDEHFSEYLRFSRPNPMNYDFYNHVNDPGYDSDDWDEEVYHEDLQKWMELKRSK